MESGGLKDLVVIPKKIFRILRSGTRKGKIDKLERKTRELTDTASDRIRVLAEIGEPEALFIDSIRIPGNWNMEDFYRPED